MWVISLSLDHVNEEGAPFDSGFDDAGPFSDTPEGDGVALDAALGEFGPAAFEDLLPRLRALAADLDAAHTAGFIHGRLHPSKVFVTPEGTYLLGARVPLVLDDNRAWPIQPPYTAPEVVQGRSPGPTADQFSLAAIAYEWMFGRPISGPAERAIDVRAIPSVDRAELARAFTRALTPEPFRRFASCTDFCDAIAAASASTPVLPLMAAGEDSDDVLGPFQPEDPATVTPIVAATPVPDLSFTAEESNVTAAEPDIDSFEPVVDPIRSPTVFSTETSTPIARTSDRAQFGGLALILAALVGAVFGFAAGYMARPRALQSSPPAIASTETERANKPTAPAPAAPAATPARKSPAPTPAPKAPPAPSAPQNAAAAEKIGRLLVRSNPSGANVQVDGVSRGVTPVALRDLDLGSREISVSRRGYVSEERRIVLTKARPSRSVEVRLSPQAAAPPRPSTPASLGRPATTTGALAIESLPSGAAVTVNGKAIGVTPVTLNDLPPGDYRVTMTLPGHQAFETTVRVVAGERARAAARLTEQEQE
jgi:serine/threonine-protein kinase